MTTSLMQPGSPVYDRYLRQVLLNLTESQRQTFKSAWTVILRRLEEYEVILNVAVGDLAMASAPYQQAILFITNSRLLFGFREPGQKGTLVPLENTDIADFEMKKTGLFRKTFTLTIQYCEGNTARFAIKNGERVATEVITAVAQCHSAGQSLMDSDAPVPKTTPEHHTSAGDSVAFDQHGKATGRVAIYPGGKFQMALGEDADYTTLLTASFQVFANFLKDDHREVFAKWAGWKTGPWDGSQREFFALALMHHFHGMKSKGDSVPEALRPAVDELPANELRPLNRPLTDEIREMFNSMFDSSSKA